MGDNWNIISSCSSNVGFDDNLCHVEEERLHALQLQPLQGNLHHQHHCGDYGFINDNPTMEEIYSAMGGLFTHLDFYRMRHRASVEAALPHPHTDNYSNHFASPPWRGFVVSMAMNHRECQYLQAVIDEGNPVYVTMILLEVKDYLHELMTHRFGSYLIQKIFQARRGMTCQQMDLTVFLIISNHRKLKDVCMDHHGAMQTMIANVRHPFTGYVVVYMLQHITIPLMKNVNGSYVIVQCVKFFPPKHKKIILDEVARNCVDIATDKIGCSAVKKCLDYGGRTSAIDILVAQIISNAMILSEDPYGFDFTLLNYIYTYIFFKFMK
ncbi:putative armadillo-like helical protein [Medicago truncatula]|uniref:Putative armadillo-like helical protein n=1 Tax=Medicago truncatula TaxID=3880 RepID=A0A396J0H5_MEDTR|nr:putative armadillo-like helical protein [Medicago truncatula]